MLDAEEVSNGFQFPLVAAVTERRMSFIVDKISEILSIISRSPDTVISAIDPVGETERD